MKPQQETRKKLPKGFTIKPGYGSNTPNSRFLKTKWSALSIF